MLTVGELREEAASPTFDLLRVGISGDTLLRHAIPYEPRPVTGADREWLREAYADFLAGGSGPQAERTRQEARDAISFPDYFPPVRRILAGHDGTIWLHRG